MQPKSYDQVLPAKIFLSRNRRTGKQFLSLRRKIMSELAVSGAAMRVVKLLVGEPPKTVAELIKATGVTRTAVTEQLNELVAAGFVERGTERLPGRGRPRHVYSATRSALLLLFCNNQQLVVPALWRAIDQLGGPKLTKKVLRRVSQELADHYSARITAKEPQERLNQLTELLCEEGGLAEFVKKDGQFALRKRSCAFISMLDENRTICCVDKQMISKVVGRPVRQMACRHKGDPYCSFEIVDDE
jgi:predicted ArsR family transcriptional regulator